MADSKPIVLRAVLDSGAPHGLTVYTTVVVVHGLMWQGANFKKLLPLATQQRTRFIAVNRRDYPGSTPYTPDERAQFERLAASSPNDAGAQAEAVEVMRDRARELYDYLVDLIQSEDIPLSRTEGEDARGGIILVGWSFGSVWATAFLAHAPSFHSDIHLSKWVRRVVFYDSSAGFLGQAVPPGMYLPFVDQSMPPAERTHAFHMWATKYFGHGEPIAIETLETRDGLEQPGSTLKRISEKEFAESTCDDPGRLPHGSDALILRLCTVHGLFTQLKDGSLYLRPGKADEPMNDWQDVDVRILWCDHSIWTMPWGARNVAEELNAAKAAGKATQKISSIRLRGANHFAHWDFPEKTLRAFLGDEEEL
ncbi:Alpha/Beta hydrolase protein [Dichomitus squalens]|uniref:Alpha/Beta hydrolase protein n=1 Tax=Dichomitus squalens TaxID=114155 RepID=A0A4V2K0K4_9APHY|nr:Alpha/Beta hydrolase protein [Dichomitus squalens]